MTDKKGGEREDPTRFHTPSGGRGHWPAALTRASEAGIATRAGGVRRGGELVVGEVANGFGEVARDAAPNAKRASLVSIVLTLLVGLWVLGHDANRWWQVAHLHPETGDLGVTAAACDPSGFCRMNALSPGGALARAGVRKGDYVRPDRAIDFARDPRVGETIDFTLRRNGALTHMRVAAAPLPVTENDRARALAAPFTFTPWMLACLIGMFVALRSRSNASTLLFGAALVCLGLSGSSPTLTESAPRLFPVFAVCSDAVYQAAPLLFFLFALDARRQASGKASPIWRILFIAYAMAQVSVGLYYVWSELTTRTLDAVDQQIYPVRTGLQALGYLLAFVALGGAWLQSRAQDRTRYAYMLISGGLLALSAKVIPPLVNISGHSWVLGDPLAAFSSIGMVAGAAVFAYAVLRHHVLDIGFALNRTLIYGVLSTLLMVAFGLIEWAVDHYMPRGSQETSALIDAGVALAVFLTFHRVRDFVEHVVEGIFFRPWQQAEAALRRFVREAAFTTRSETLTETFAAALGRYAEGAEAAVYLLREDGGYRRADGLVEGVGERLDADDPALIAMRAEPKTLVPDAASSRLKAALIAPMVNRNEVIGVALLGPKPSGGGYRPDEIELVGWATRHVGLDLHALKVEQLEAAQARQAEQISTLRTEVATLRSVIPQRA